MKLLLFDIDGTLLVTNGEGRRTVERALARLFDRPMTTDGVSFSGKTDPQIMGEILARNGLSPAEAAARLPEALAAYVQAAQARLVPHHVEVLPGARDLIAHLAAQPDVQLALLTGNLQVTAYLKLDAAGLADYFSFGAFGSDHADRYHLPALAVQRALAHTGRAYAGKNVVIIGDTEHDIRCGRGIGAFAVGVCTGLFGRAALAPHDPDLLLDDLRDHDRFLQAVLYDGV